MRYCSCVLILLGRRSVVKANEVVVLIALRGLFELVYLDNRCTLTTDACPPRILRLPNTSLPLGQFTLGKLSVSAAPNPDVYSGPGVAWKQKFEFGPQAIIGLKLNLDALVIHSSLNGGKFLRYEGKISVTTDDEQRSPFVGVRCFGIKRRTA